MKRNLVIALICTLTACSQKPTIENESIKPKKIEQANWLVGTWFSKSGERSNYETWNKYNDSTYVGSSYAIQHGDTVSAESITLVQQGEEINYIPTVQGQNNDMPVMFKLVSSDSNKLIFENPAHDFPQINYILESASGFSDRGNFRSDKWGAPCSKISHASDGIIQIPVAVED